jgi:sigma-E factor negative regulatory protein RseB
VKVLRPAGSPSAICALSAAATLAALLLVPVAGTAPAAARVGASAESGNGKGRPVALGRDQPTPLDSLALLLLERASRAEQTTTYDGVQFVSTWGAAGTTSQLIEVEHLPGEGTALRLHGTPGAREVSLFRPARNQVLGGVGQDSLHLLASNYDLTYDGQASVAGRRADVVTVFQRGVAGSGEVAARFWLDVQSGVPLRREVYDDAGRTVRASAFVDVRVGEPVWMSHPHPRSPDPWDDPLTVAQLADLRTNGWACPDRLGGGLTLQVARLLPDSGERIVHLAYSDGLSSVSVFEQRGRLDVEAMAGFRPVSMGEGVIHVREGIPRYLVWTSGGRVFTVVADAPAATVREVVATLPPPDGDRSRLSEVTARIGRGMARVASWFSPLD